MPDAPGSPFDCERSLAATRGFLNGELPGGEERAWRAHLDRCGECRDAYRSAVVTTARVGRQLREERERGDRERRRQSFRREVREATHPQRRLSGTRLRLMLYPAVMLLLLMQFLGGPVSRAAGLGIELVEGAAWLGEEVLAPGEEHRPESGQLVQLAPGARLELRGKQRHLVLHGPARLLVESSLGERLRLVAGSLLHQGPGTLFTPHGVVEVREGRARVAVDARALELEVQEGRLEVLDAAGRRVLRSGEVLRLP